MEEKCSTLCIVAGPNGSGKTSTTMQLLHYEWTENSLYINPDNIAQEQFGDWNSPVAVMKAAELATKMRYECLEKRKDFVFETVFSSDEKLDFVRKANHWSTECMFMTILLKTKCLSCCSVLLMVLFVNNMWKNSPSGHSPYCNSNQNTFFTFFLKSSLPIF